MLKNGPKFGKDFFDELLVKIKEIRASEKRFYQKKLIYTKNVVLAMIKIVKQHKSFTKMFKISCILLLLE